MQADTAEARACASPDVNGREDDFEADAEAAEMDVVEHEEEVDGRLPPLAAPAPAAEDDEWDAVEIEERGVTDDDVEEEPVMLLPWLLRVVAPEEEMDDSTPPAAAANSEAARADTTGTMAGDLVPKLLAACTAADAAGFPQLDGGG